MSKRFECEHNWIIDNNKRNTKESLIVYDEECNTLDDLCELLNQQAERIAELEEQLEYFSKRDEEQEQQLEKQAKFRINSIKEYQQENQKLKNRWKKLKEYVLGRENHNNECNEDERLLEDNIIWTKMKELENRQ